MRIAAMALAVCLAGSTPAAANPVSDAIDWLRGRVWPPVPSPPERPAAAPTAPHSAPPVTEAPEPPPASAAPTAPVEPSVNRHPERPAKPTRPRPKVETRPSPAIRRAPKVPRASAPKISCADIIAIAGGKSPAEQAALVRRFNLTAPQEAQARACLR